ncbi:unnamed protein product [Periconia digitata]|uniref:Uncharacterized protein n=1 Tax=Periconia digitata TaxID=1303443 RepID=A0A9W4XR98_9PLEO|nr:unnamed protein product [Periconia digitata]
MSLQLVDALPRRVETTFKEAKSSEALVFSATEVDVIRTAAGIPFQIRYCPSLAKKPEPHKEREHKKSEGDKPKKKFDPFESPPASLFITDIPSNTSNPSHFLVLNKFPVIPNHFILATKENKPQTHFLEEDDLAAAHACLKSWVVENASSTQKHDRLFAFFNSGEYSGASQPHRHLQFLPIKSMRDGQTSEDLDLLVDTILENGVPISSPSPSSIEDESIENDNTGVIHHPGLPFMHFAQRFSADPTGTELQKIYRKLYYLAQDAVQNYSQTSQRGLFSTATASDGDLPISYNLAMTTTGIAILPRRSEGHVLLGDDGSQIGYVQLNGTALGGTLMVKQKKEWDMLRKSPAVLDEVLSSIGVPSSRAYTVPPSL